VLAPVILPGADASLQREFCPFRAVKTTKKEKYSNSFFTVYNLKYLIKLRGILYIPIIQRK
jgi:hypothetical protein